jgi:hypothetical protein
VEAFHGIPTEIRRSRGGARGSGEHVYLLELVLADVADPEITLARSKE